MQQILQEARKILDAIFAPWIPKDTKTSLSWSEDAAWAQIQQEPLRAKALINYALIVLLLLVIWSAFAEVDEVTRGEARVIPSSQLQIVQSVDGGVVEEIFIREGQIVEKGQVLLKIDPTRFVSNLRESKAQYLALQAKAVRLRALIDGTPFSPPKTLEKDIPNIVAQERALYKSSLSEMEAQESIAREQLEQRKQELAEAQANYRQASQSYELAARELKFTKPLVASGAVSEVDLLRLERDLARFRGEKAQSQAKGKRLESSIVEAQSKIGEVKLIFKNQLSNELSETLATLKGLSEGSRALEDRVSKAEVRSLVKGTVKRLLVNTIGGVVQPGTELVEIVPLDDALFLEAKILPKDIGFLRPLQEATVKFTAYDFAIYGGLEAIVDSIGADTVIDENGDAHYIVRVKTKEANLRDDLLIIPGMVAQVDILTGKKTVLNYLLKPVLRAHANALSER